MQDFKERDAIYLRKSRMDPESESINETLARHEDTLMKFAARIGLNITGIYKEVVSGDGLFTRPEMVRLLQDVGQGKYTGVVCMEIDRLGRSSQKDSGIIFETLKDNNVFIVTPNKTYDLNDEIDEQSVEMQSFIARQELKSIKRRLRKGVEKTCEQGGHISEPPYGYRRAYIDKRPTLEICEEEAQVVRMIYDMYVNQHIGGYTIANTLNNMGFHPRKNDHFSRNTIRFILENPTYAGKVIWNRHRHIRPKFPGDKHRQVLNDKDKWIIADGIHPAIISTDMYETAQIIRKTRTHPPLNTGELKNPFAGIIYCKNCGASIVRQYSLKNGNRLMCPNTGCCRSIKAEYIEDYLLKKINDALESCRSTVQKQVDNETEKQSDAIRNIISELEKNKKVITAQKSSLHDFLEKGVYDTSTFLERNSILNERIKNIDLEIEQQQKKLLSIRSLPPIKEVEPMMCKLLDEYDMLTAAEKNSLLKQLFVRIEYVHTKEQKGNEFSLEIEWRYNL